MTRGSLATQQNNRFQVISERTVVEPPEKLEVRCSRSDLGQNAHELRFEPTSAHSALDVQRGFFYMVGALLGWLLQMSLDCLPVFVRLRRSFDHSGCLRLASTKLCYLRTNLALSSPSLPRKIGPRFVVFHQFLATRMHPFLRRCIASGLCCCLFLEYSCLLPVYSSLKFWGLHPGCVLKFYVGFSLTVCFRSPGFDFLAVSLFLFNHFVTFCNRCTLYTEESIILHSCKRLDRWW